MLIHSSEKLQPDAGSMAQGMAQATAPARSAHVLLIHGLNSNPQEFGLIEFALRRQQISYDLLTIPGYTDADRHTPTTWRAWLDAAAAVINDDLPDEASQQRRPVILGGLCIGAMLAAALVIEGRCKVDGLLLLSPSFAYDGWGLSRWLHWRHLGYFLRLGRYVHVSEREPYGIKNPKIRKWVMRDMMARASSAAGPATLPLWSFQQGEKLIRHVRRGLASITCPTLALHAREDEVTRLTSVQRYLRRLPAASTELQVLENSYHMITIDNDRQNVVDAIVRFSQRLTVHPSVHPHAEAPAMRFIRSAASMQPAAVRTT